VAGWSRCNLQHKEGLREVLLMTDPTWRARHPISRQLAELQSAAAGVTTWEQTLAVQPAGER